MTEKREAYTSYEDLPEDERKAIDGLTEDIMTRRILQAYRDQMMDEIIKLMDDESEEMSISIETQSGIRSRKKELANTMLSEIALCADDFKKTLQVYSDKDSGIVEWLLRYASDEALKGTLFRIEQAQNNFSVLHTLIKSEQLRRASRKRDRHR